MRFNSSALSRTLAAPPGCRREAGSIPAGQASRSPGTQEAAAGLSGAVAADDDEYPDDIVEQVRRVSDLIGDISASSIEQSHGIGQVGEAVAQLDQVTQQNAALVEQSAAAAESLKLQAAQMAQVVSVFKIDAGT